MLKKYIEYIKEGEMAPGGGRLPFFRILPSKQQKPLEKIPDLTSEEQTICDEALEFFKPVIEWNKNHAYGANRNNIEVLPITFEYTTGIPIPSNILNGMIDSNSRNTDEITLHNIKVGSYRNLINFYEKTKNKIKFPTSFEQISDLTTYLEDNLKSYRIGSRAIRYSANDISNPTLEMNINPYFDESQDNNEDGYYSSNLNLDDLSLISTEIKKIASKYKMIKCDIYLDNGELGYIFEFEIL
jgi:hypothetical protein